VRFKRWSDEAIRATLAEFWTRTGRAPRAGDLGATGWRGPTSTTLRRRFGSLQAAGRIIAEKAGRHLKRVLLELGGKAP